MGIKFYDTNAILKNYKYINEKFLLSSITLTELEDIKVSSRKDAQIKYAARKAEHFLKANINLYDVIIYNSDILDIIYQKGLLETNDNGICACAKKASETYPDLVFVTDDLSCLNIASKIFELNVDDTIDYNIICKGYKEISGTPEEINSLYKTDDMYNNQYIITYDTTNNKYAEMRYENGNLKALKLPSSDVVKAKNAPQRCALDALMNEEIEIAAIVGGYGSGKTFLAMTMALYAIKKGIYSKILGIREPIGEGKEIGFLPGDMENKTDLFFLPLVQQLNMGIDEYNELKEKEVIETTIPYFMKGTTYNDTLIIVDEAEDLTEQQIKLIGTRIGEHSKIIFAGDYKQSLVNKTLDNPLMKMCNEFKGLSNFASVYLDEDVRSTASKMFAELYEEKIK